MNDLTSPRLPFGSDAIACRPGEAAAAEFRFDLSVPRDARKPLAMAWLGLGMTALLASGLFSILLVLSRTPQLQTLFPVADFFRVALVVHVDLSVLVWFLAFGGALWTLSGTPRLVQLAWCAYALSAVGTAAMCASRWAHLPPRSAKPRAPCTWPLACRPTSAWTGWLKKPPNSVWPASSHS